MGWGDFLASNSPVGMNAGRGLDDGATGFFTGAAGGELRGARPNVFKAFLPAGQFPLVGKQIGLFAPVEAITGAKQNGRALH